MQEVESQDSLKLHPPLPPTTDPRKTDKSSSPGFAWDFGAALAQDMPQNGQSLGW